MNIIVILASGVGNRFGDPVPKQYHLVKGRPVIEYTIDACLKSKKAEEVIVVARDKYVEHINKTYGLTAIQGGEERNISFKKALDYIKDNYTCENLLVVDAVNPLITGVMLDKFFGFLDEYDMAITTSKLPTSLGCYDEKAVDRSRYYMIQNPQSYKFDMLYDNFDQNSQYTVIAHQMPENAKLKLYWDFKDYAKIIYPHDIAVIEALLDERDRKKKFEVHKNDASLAIFRNFRVSWKTETRIWERDIDEKIEYLFKKWDIVQYTLNPVSWMGLVFEAYSESYGEVILKVVPPFINRFEREIFAIKNLSSSYMEEMIDYDKKNSAMLLRRVMPGDYVVFQGNEADVKVFFEIVLREAIKVDSLDCTYMFPNYYDELKSRAEIVGNFKFHQEKCSLYLEKACKFYIEASRNKDTYLLHLDLHERNILKDSNKIIAIDPWGFIGIKEMEIAPFVAYTMYDDVNNSVELYDKMKNIFHDLISDDLYDKVMYIHCCLLLVGTLKGKNDNFESANKWWNVIDKVFVSNRRIEI